MPKSEKFWIFIALLVVWVVLANIDKYLATFLFNSLLVLGIFLLIRKIWKNAVHKELQRRGVGNHERTNIEMHSRKCYMEDLSDGEEEVARLLVKNLSYKDYFLFNNLTLPLENNSSTQIDHIIVSRFGIFVIESKDYKGWIFGGKNQAFWTQSLPGGRRKFRFQNPIRQNYAHVMALKNLLPFVGDSFLNIVVFSNKSQFRTELPENVLHLDGLVEYIKKYTNEIIQDADLQMTLGRLSYMCQTVDITASEHIENLQANHDSRS